MGRRQWVRASAAAGLGTVACSGPDKPTPGPIEPDHAVATYEMDEHEAIAWVWAPQARRATIVFVNLDTGEERNSDPFDLGAAGTANVLLTGLEAGTSYRWHARFDSGTTTEWSHFRTGPRLDDAADLRFLFGADIDTNPLYNSPIFDHMTRSGADFLVSLGDVPYSDFAPGVTTTEAYRDRHREVRARPGLQELLSAMGAYAIYDDHEVFCNWGGFYVAEAARIATGLAVWDEWFPVRPSLGDTRYRAWRWGSLVGLFMLDTRRYRSDPGTPDVVGKTMLGAAQRDWLLDRLSASPTAFKIVLTTIPLDFGNTGEDWSVYRTERDEILNAIRARDIRGVVFLSADQHWFAAHHHSSGFFEYQVGPVAQFTRIPGALRPEIVARVEALNYGDIVIRAQPEPVLEFTARDAQGAPLFTETLTPDYMNR